MGVRVLALVVRKRLIGGWEIRRLEIRGWGVRERRSAGVGSLRDGSQLGQPGTVAGHSIMPVKEHIRGALLGKIRLREPYKIKKGFSVFEL